jgi:hypothetical protein
MKDTLPEQRKSSSAISHALDEFQLVDLPLNQTIVLRKSQPSDHCCLVPLTPPLQSFVIRGSGWQHFSPARHQASLPLANEGGAEIPG